MANCPFHSLVDAHTEMVCTLNHALIGGLADSLVPGQVRACLDPGENRCCVTLRGADPARDAGAGSSLG
jgi:predicted ArsR family transcriptional regulator